MSESSADGAFDLPSVQKNFRGLGDKIKWQASFVSSSDSGTATAGDEVGAGASDPGVGATSTGEGTVGAGVGVTGFRFTVQGASYLSGDLALKLTALAERY